MKSITLTDAMTGETLDIEFDLGSDTMTINGEPVERKRPLETSEDEIVYGPPGIGGQKLYHLTRAQIDQMK